MDTTTYNKAARLPLKPGVKRGWDMRPEGVVPKTILVHTTNGRLGSAFADECNYLYTSLKVSAHYVISKQGDIVQILDPMLEAWHAGIVNDMQYANENSIGIECHFTPGESWTLALHNALTDLCLMLMQRFTIIGIERHRAVAPKRKIDPSGFEDAEFEQWRAEVFKRAATAPTNINPLPYSGASKFLMTTPHVVMDDVVSKIAAVDNPNYTKADIKLITHFYYYYATMVGMDWLLPLAQCLHETAWLKSWWAARPRRNPAGLGVTGEKQAKQPPTNNYAYHPLTKMWHKGLSFPSWDEGVQAHIGHLLCYILKDEDMNAVQLQMSNKSPRRSILGAYRGVAPQLIGLNGRWAVPGSSYGQNIANVANKLV